MKEKTYRLQLCDDRRWEFAATEKLHDWLDHFARIMQLEPGRPESSPDCKLTLIPYKPEETPPCEKHQWDLYKSGSILRVWQNDKNPEIFVELNLEWIDHEAIRIINMWNTLKPLYRYYVGNGGGPMHAGFAGLRGKGFLIAAPGGTGKSTSISRLPEYYDKPSDDSVLIVKNNLAGYRVHPQPTWSDHLCERRDSSFRVQNSLPLNAIFFLEQSDKDEVVPIDPGKAASEIFEGFKQSWQTYWSRMDDRRKKECRLQVFNNAVDLSKAVPCYLLRATLRGRFWNEIEQIL